MGGGRRGGVSALVLTLLWIGGLPGCAGDPQDRIGRIYGWKARPTAGNLERIRSYLKDPDRDVRVTALHALTSVPVDDAAAISLNALEDEDGFVRAAASAALRKVSRPGTD